MGMGALAAGRQFTSLTRGVSLIAGTTTGGLAEAWGRGTAVEITDAPILLEISNKISGTQNFDTILTYNSGLSFTPGSNQIPSIGYVDASVNQGAATSTETNGGIVELGTLAEQASSYDGGVNQPTVLQTKNSTSTCQVVGSYNVVASSTTGKIDKNCIDQTASYNLTATTTILASSVNSNPLNLNGIAYKFPPSQTSTSTSLVTDGSGNLSWEEQGWQLILASTYIL